MQLRTIEISNSKSIFHIIGDINEDDIQELNPIKESTSNQIIIDLSECTKLCSLAIGFFAMIHNQQKKFYIKNPSTQIKELLSTFKLDTIFKIICTNQNFQEI